MKSAIVYARVSTEEQGKGYSLPTQIEKSKEYAEEHGYAVLQVFQDTFTGTTLDRPALADLYEFVADNQVDVLIVYDIDRLSRDVGNQAIIEMEMQQAGIEIEYVLGGYTKTPEGELMKLIKSGIAQYENRQRIERSRRGKRGRAQAGHVSPAGRPPFGYTYYSEPHKGWFEINEREAEVVRLIYHLLIVEGLSSYKIARRLWEQHILTRGDYSDVVFKKNGRGEWSPTTVRRIISNPVYKGIWYYGKTRRTKVNGKTKQVKLPKKEWIAVDVPAIIDEKTWETAQKCLTRNKRNSKRNTKRKYLLRSMIFCTCGRRWGGRYKTQQKLSYYRCYAHECKPWYAHCESRFSYRKEVVEQAVWEKVTSFFLEPECLQAEIAKRKEESGGDIQRRQDRLEAIEDELEDNKRKMGILLDQVLMGDFSQSLVDSRKQELRLEHDKLTTEQRRISDELEAVTMTAQREQTLLELADRVRDNLTNADFKTKRRLLELLEIRVDVIDKEHCKLSGLISAEGLIVSLSSA